MTCTRCGNQRSKRYALPVVLVDPEYLDEGLWESAQYLDLCKDCVPDVSDDIRVYAADLRALARHAGDKTPVVGRFRRFLETIRAYTANEEPRW